MPSQLATLPDLSFVEDLMSFGEDYAPRVGDEVEAEDEGVTGVVVGRTDDTVAVRSADGQTHEVPAESWFRVEASPTIAGVWDRHQQSPVPDGVAFSDDAVPAELAGRVNAEIHALGDGTPVDFHPGSGGRVRDLVHPSLYPFIAGRSRCSPPVKPPEPPSSGHDRFGRVYEGSAYQWLPTPFRVDADGRVRAQAYVNNLDGERFPGVLPALESLFACALPLVESVLGYVHTTQFFREGGDEHEGELPERVKSPGFGVPCAPRSVRGRELLVIPKIVEYTLQAGEVHEGVWHVEGMSHEHIVATCVYVAHRDEALVGGDLAFKRAYTREEAGRLFWGIDQSRPRAVEDLVEQGLIPVGTVATPAGRLLVFPNSHIHQLQALSVSGRASAARRRVVVFWIVDPDVQLPSTREVPPQQGVIAHAEALDIRLRLMDERKRHKQSLNVRAVSLCEH